MNSTPTASTPTSAPAATPAASHRPGRGGGSSGRGGRGGSHAGARPASAAVAPSPATAASTAAGATGAAAASRPAAPAASASAAAAAAVACVSVDSLEPDAKGLNLTVQVRELRLIVMSKTVKIVEALVGDKTGVVWLILRNAQSDSITLGQWLLLRGAHVQMFKSQMRLAITPRIGSIETCPPSLQPASAQIKLDNNVSNAEYELISNPA